MSTELKACVIGWPIAHSRSPLIHGYWLSHYGIHGSYTKEAVRPEDFEAFVRRLRETGFAGANVTVPHKEALFALAERRDAAAEAVGAANTLWFEGASLCVSNTDTHGFMTNLDARAPGWDDGPRPAVVLGAGGAARAILHGLVTRGLEEIRLLNRTRLRADDLARRFGGSVRVEDWEERDGAVAGAGLLVNTTTLGMGGAAPLAIGLDRLPPDAVVADIVYVPLETDLLAGARARGNRVVDGLGMLLHQAVPGFEKWFGVRPEITAELRNLIVRDLMAEIC